MDWILLGVVVLMVGLWIALTRGGQVAADKARAYRKDGAVVIDVRSPAEFAAGHVEGAINLNYTEIAERIEKAVPDRKTVLLLYCLRGGRSAVARTLVRRRGYLEAHNLGSFERAQSILGSSLNK